MITLVSLIPKLIPHASLSACGTILPMQADSSPIQAGTLDSLYRQLGEI